MDEGHVMGCEKRPDVDLFLTRGRMKNMPSVLMSKKLEYKRNETKGEKKRNEERKGQIDSKSGYIIKLIERRLNEGI